MMQNSKVGQLFYLVHDLWRQTRRWQEILSREKGLTMPQLRTLLTLSNGDGISQSEIGVLTDSDPMTVSGVLERLEAKGLVWRELNPADSRAKLVYVTDAARALVTEARGQAVTREPEILAGISDADFATVLAVLRRVSENLTKTLPESSGAEK